MIALIHRQESMSLLGIPIVRYIDIDDAVSILRAVHETPRDRPIEIVLHTPGGLVLAAQQIAGALAAHQIVMDTHAALGPVDPQLGQYPAASILAALEFPGTRDDQTLIMADIARKAIVQVEGFVCGLLERHLESDRARDVAHLLATGVWTHDHPLSASELPSLGLPVRIGVGEEERELLTLYPQPRGRGAPWSPCPARRSRRRRSATASAPSARSPRLALSLHALFVKNRLVSEANVGVKYRDRNRTG